MAASTLDHDQSVPPVVTKGHGTAALGPSDSSDSGSDIQGGPGLNRDDGLFPPAGNTSDPDVDAFGATTAGADIGDANLDSDSDRYGTGERAAVGRDSTLPTDTILRDDQDRAIDGESIGDDIDSDRPTRDELVGADAENEDLAGDADTNTPSVDAYRPAQAGQDARADRPSGTRTSNEPGVRGFARAGGKPAEARDKVPVFDRGGREDSAKER